MTPLLFLILGLKISSMYHQTAARHMPEDFIMDMLVPMNASKLNRHRRSDFEEIEGSGDSYREIPPIGSSLGLYMDRIQIAPAQASNRESMENQAEDTPDHIETLNDEGSGDHEEEIPKVAAVVSPMEDPFMTHEDGLEDVYKDLTGAEVSETEKDDQNKHDNTLSVLVSGEDIPVKPDDVVLKSGDDDEEEGSGGSILPIPELTVGETHESAGSKLLDESQSLNEVHEDEVQKKTVVVVEEAAKYETEHTTDPDVIEVEDVNTERTSPDVEEEQAPAGEAVVVDDIDGRAGEVSAHLESLVANSTNDETNTESTDTATELTLNCELQDDCVEAKDDDIPVASTTATPEFEEVVAVDEKRITEELSILEQSTTEITIEATEESTHVVIQISSTTESTTAETTTDEILPVVVTLPETTSTSSTETLLLEDLSSTVAIPVIEPEVTSSVSTTTESVEVLSTTEESFSSTTVLVGLIPNNIEASKVNDGDLRESESHQKMTVLAETPPQINVAGSDQRQLAVYVLVGFAGICLVVLLAFLLMKRKTKRRKVDLESSQDKDTEKTLLSLGKYKEDSDENNVKNNEITPLVIKQNSQINKFEKNQHFSSPKNLNTTANEKNIEKDNVLKSTQAIIDEEDDDAKKPVADEKKSQGENPLEEEKKGLLDANVAPPTEKHIVRTHLDQDSIPRKPIIVMRNGNGYHAVSQDPI